jgi:hypothetical protein
VEDDIVNRILSIAICMSLMASQAHGDNVYSDEIWDVLNFRKKIERGDWLPFKMAFPDEYVVLPLNRSQSEPALHPGFLVGSREAIKELWQQYEKDETAELYPSSGVFYVGFSWDIGQKKNSKDFTTADKEIYATFKKAGISHITIRSVNWNGYHVKAVEGISPSKELIFVAWIGLNLNGETMKVRYICPENASFGQEQIVWNRFLNDSMGISYEKLNKNIEAENERFLQKLHEKHESETNSC